MATYAMYETLHRQPDDVRQLLGEGWPAAEEAATRLGIFGAPTFVVGEELFWGNDRLEDALEWAKDGGDAA